MYETLSTIALVGNPNTGKSTVFNALTGLKQKIGNYPGVTVERKLGTTLITGTTYTIIDLPGSYSLNPKTVDERIAYETLIGSYEHEQQPDAVVVILDASNLSRNLYLATQVMDVGLPMVIVLNMMDVAEEKGYTIDVEAMSDQIGVPVIGMTANKQRQIERLKQIIAENGFVKPITQRWSPTVNLLRATRYIEEEWLKENSPIPEERLFIESLRLLSNSQIDREFVGHPKENQILSVINKARKMMEDVGANWMAEEVLSRYTFIETLIQHVDEHESNTNSLTDKIDAVVTHAFWGPIIFVAILLLMFQSIFSWAEPFMDLIDYLFLKTGSWIAHTLPKGMLNDLIVEGVIAGLAGVVIFLPQIMILFFFISILEGSGYMARAAFVMDGFMTKIGLHGRSVVPLMSGFACAVPGIMATRTIESWKDRLITIMVLPFMACSARLPVYALMIAAFIPEGTIFGVLTYQGLTFFGLYFFGIVTAIIVAFIFKKIFHNTESTPFIMELPTYKMPSFKNVIMNMFERGFIFIKEAGKIIMAISIVLWFLATFPHIDVPDSVTANSSVSSEDYTATISTEAYQLRHSYAGKIGTFIEPLIEPLGFDWKIGIGLLTSFAAREVMVGTLNTIYSIQAEDDNMSTLKEKMISDINPNTGRPVFSTLTALSLMIFFALAMQCMSTLAICKRETNSWKWPIVMFFYMTTLAYLSSLILFQTGSALGY